MGICRNVSGDSVSGNRAKYKRFAKDELKQVAWKVFESFFLLFEIFVVKINDHLQCQILVFDS